MSYVGSISNARSGIQGFAQERLTLPSLPGRVQLAAEFGPKSGFEPGIIVCNPEYIRPGDGIVNYSSQMHDFTKAPPIVLPTNPQEIVEKAIRTAVAALTLKNSADIVVLRTHNQGSIDAGKVGIGALGTGNMISITQYDLYYRSSEKGDYEQALQKIGGRSGFLKKIDDEIQRMTFARGVGTVVSPFLNMLKILNFLRNPLRQTNQGV